MRIIIGFAFLWTLRYAKSAGSAICQDLMQFQDCVVPTDAHDCRKHMRINHDNTVVVNLQLFFFLHHLCPRDLLHRPYVTPVQFLPKTMKYFLSIFFWKIIAALWFAATFWCASFTDHTRLLHNAFAITTLCAATVGFTARITGHSLPFPLHLYPLACPFLAFCFFATDVEPNSLWHDLTGVCGVIWLMAVVRTDGWTSSESAAVARDPESPTVTTLMGLGGCMAMFDLSSEWRELESGLLDSVSLGTTAQVTGPRSSKWLSLISAAKSELLDKLVLTMDMVPGESGSDSLWPDDWAFVRQLYWSTDIRGLWTVK